MVTCSSAAPRMALLIESSALLESREPALCAGAGAGPAAVDHPALVCGAARCSGAGALGTVAVACAPPPRIDLAVPLTTLAFARVGPPPAPRAQPTPILQLVSVVATPSGLQVRPFRNPPFPHPRSSLRVGVGPCSVYKYGSGAPAGPHFSPWGDGRLLSITPLRPSCT